jgi:hypothetical protein
LKRGIPNQALFEAYVQYCFSPKHTVGEQLLDVRRDKRERAAYAASSVFSLCIVPPECNLEERGTPISAWPVFASAGNPSGSRNE